MPKKKNFLGGMQNYNPNTGEYESRLVKANGEGATKANMPGGEETSMSKEFAVSESDSKSFKQFKKTTITPKPEWAKKIDDEMKPEFEKARKKDAEIESRLKKLAEKSGVDYNEIKNEYINSLDKTMKDKRFREEEVSEVALNLLEEEYNSAKEKDDTFEKINNARMGTAPKEQSLSKTIKSQLKDAGFDTKKLSVRNRNAGYSSAIDIEIKDPNIDINKVREIAEKHESYDRDIATGEILAGGNTYVHVNYEYGIFDEIGKKGKDNALSLMKQADNSQGNGIEVDDHVFLFKDGKKYFLSASSQGLNKIGRGSSDIYSPEDLAIKIWKLKKFGRITR